MLPDPSLLVRRCLSLFAASCVLAAAAAHAAPNPVTATVKTTTQRLSVGQDVEVELTLRIADGWHINSDQPGQEFLVPTRVQFQLPAGVELEELVYPKPSLKELRFGGDKQLKLFEGNAVVKAKLHYAELTAAPATPELLLHYQACNDTLCLPPQKIRIPLRLKLSMFQGVAYAGVNDEEADNVVRLLSNGWLVVVPAVLVIGLLLNLTPCVYPLVSVTLAYFGSQAGHSRAKTINLALAYASGIVVSFSALGVFAALSGSFFGSALANPAVNVAIALLMFALALSSFGVYQVSMPSGLVARLGGSFGGAFGALFMGMTMGMVAAPCVGPFVVGMFLVVGSRGDTMLGMQLFSLLAIGLGLPYVVLAVAAGSITKLPRSGDWLRWVEHLFGCVLLGMGIYFLQPVLPDNVEKVLMPLFLAGAIGYLAFLDPAGRASRSFTALRVSAGAIALAVLAMQHLPTGEPQCELAFEDFSSDAFVEAKRSGGPFVIEFFAEWCLPCKEMKERTFKAPEVVGLAHGVRFMTVDMTTKTDPVDRILRSFEVIGAPTTLVYGADGEEFTRRLGFVGPEEFAQILRDAGQENLAGATVQACAS